MTPPIVATYGGVCAGGADRRSTFCPRYAKSRFVRPEGAYYVFLRLISATENAEQFSRRLLQEARVTVTPGSAFGSLGEHHVRMAYCVEDDTINLAFDRMEAYFGR